MKKIIELFNYYKNKKDFFINEFNTSILEDIFFLLIRKFNIKTFAFKEPDLRRFNNQINLVSIDGCNPLDDLSTSYFKNNIYNYSETKDIVLLSNMQIPVMIDNNTYDCFVEEKLYLIDKLPIHFISYIDNNNNKINKIVNMEEHCKFNSIQIYDTSILTTIK